MSQSDVVKGLKQLQHRLTILDFIGIPAGPFLRDWRENMKDEAIRNAPDWRHKIVESLRGQQDSAKFPLWARVFTEVPEARWTEYGTGLLSEDPLSPRQRYFPPPERLREWAEDHGMDPYDLAVGIHARGGTPPTHWMSDAERAADAKMSAQMGRFARRVEIQAEII